MQQLHAMICTLLVPIQITIQLIKLILTFSISSIAINFICCALTSHDDGVECKMQY